MNSQILLLPDAQVESIIQEDHKVILTFFRAYIIKTMDDSKEETKWRQAGSLVVEDAEITDGEIPKKPCVIKGGDINDNTYVYRDMIQIPLDSKGAVGFELEFEGLDSKLVVAGDHIKLNLFGNPKYVQHIHEQT